MRVLLDEMFPAATCDLLTAEGHDAVAVRQIGLAGRPDPEVAGLARGQRRVLVTENVRDFAAEPDLVILIVLKSTLPPAGMAHHLARRIVGWAAANPNPYVGLHWGSTVGDP